MHAMSVHETKPEQILNVHCKHCGAPAVYDIKKQSYTCRFCGQETGLGDAAREKIGFRKLVQENLKEERPDFEPAVAKCPSCGAEVLFPKNEVMKTCSFCRRELALQKFTEMPSFPELIVPFRITEDEARSLLLRWCDENASKKEAKEAKALAKELKGYYLPYELVRGPISAKVTRAGTSRAYHCRGELENTFVNTSSQLDNLTLDGMEPYDLDELTEFSFAYLARQKAKVPDMDDAGLDRRTKTEVQKHYAPVVQKTLESEDIDILPEIEHLMKLPVMLPAYYIRRGSLFVAVNGQTGKVSVASQTKKRKTPWQLRAVGMIFLVAALILAALYFFMNDPKEALEITGYAAIVYIPAVYLSYQNAYAYTEGMELFSDLFTTDAIYERKDGALVPSEKTLVEADREPMFFETIDGKETHVKIDFHTKKRTVRNLIVLFVLMFLPLILAWILNGFSFTGLEFKALGGWLVISVPVGIAYYLVFGKHAMHDLPYVYRKTLADDWKRVKLPGDKSGLHEILAMLWRRPFIFVTFFLLVMLAMSTHFILTGF